MRRTFGIDFEQFGSRFIAFVPRFEVDHSHTVAGILCLGHQAVAGQRRDRFNLIHRQQGGLNLVQRLFRALQGCSRRGIHIDINHTLILIGNKSGRQDGADAPGRQEKQDQRRIGKELASEIFFQADVVPTFKAVVSSVEDNKETSQQIGAFAFSPIMFQQRRERQRIDTGDNDCNGQRQ